MSVSSLVLPVLLVLLCGSSRAYYAQQVSRLADPEDGVEGAQAYLLPPLPPRYRPHGNWEPAPDPRLYILTENDLDEDQVAAGRVKRNNSPNLSIVNSLDVLRQRLLLEMARRRMRQSEGQISANRELLDNIGKRQISQSELAGLNMDETVHASSAGNSRSRRTADSDWSASSRGQRKQL